MEKKLLKWLINTIAILVAVHLVPGILYTGDWWGLLLVAIVFGFVNSFIRPFIKFFTFPIIMLSLGLFIFVINALMLVITSSLSDFLGLGFTVNGFKAALLGAFIISIVSTLLNCLLPAQEED
ncbi:MAG: phage holin family protein [Nitrospiraceae bacterium]|jgi:putative membrane protein|nr:MAG: phage holin family protein [Nitrospiraceae bacterium]